MNQSLWKQTLLILVLLLSGQLIYGQDLKTVTGTVKDKNTNEVLKGASVLEFGTKNGITTDDQGRFSIKLKLHSKLSFSIIGYDTQTLTFAGQAEMNIQMVPATSNNLNEVVVTALGIKKDKRTLNYSTQTVSTTDLTKARETNIGNSLSGKVAGLDVTRTGSGVTGSTRIILRGERSISGNSQALVVLDGVPISSAAASPANSNGGRDVGDGISNINPDDIASIDVLKGASAAALYGSRASNGALIITTKKGNARKGLGVNVNSSIQMEQAMMLRNYQNIYGQGNDGAYSAKSESAWGAKMQGQQVATWSANPADKGKTYAYAPHPDNLKNFYDLATTLNNGFTISGGSNRTTGYFSYTNTNSKGIVNTNQLNRHNLNFRVTSDITDKISFDAKLTYLTQRLKNSIRTGEAYDNVNRQIARVPSNISLNDMKNYSYTQTLTDGRTLLGQVTQNYWNPGSNGGQNPYWILNNTPTIDERNRMMGFASFTYKILPELKFMIRSGFDKIIDNSELKWFNDTYTIAQNGNYIVNNGEAYETNNDVLFSYNKEFGKDWTLDANLGGNVQSNRSISSTINANGLNYPNQFITSNAMAVSTSRGYTETQKQSVYATADIGFRNYLMLTFTGRRDRSSTLPVANNIYNFGAAGITAIVSDMFKLPEFISFAKVRASTARTGNDASAYMTSQVYSIGVGGSGIIVNRGATLSIADLKPEITNSQEGGIDLKLFKNRFGVEFTMYNSNSMNQLIGVALPSESGFTNKFINAGNIRNYGMEIVLSATPIEGPDFKWNTSINYAQNKNKVIEINPGVSEITQTSDYMNSVKIVKGQSFGDLYGRGFVRDAHGAVVVNENGIPTVTSGQTVYLGNTRPKWIGGWSNKFTYKNLSLSILISARIGGIVSSLTNAVLNGDGFTEETLAGRDGFVYKGVNEDGTPNTKKITAQQYWQAVGGKNTAVGEAFTYSASNIRLREVVLSYAMPEKFFTKTPFKSLTFSLTGRNLFFIMNKANGFDPEMMPGSASTSIGLESFGLPPTRTMGFNLSFGF